MTGRPSFKRFYKAVTLEPAEGGFSVLLDGRKVRTPKANPFVLPTQGLAREVAAEWGAQKEHVDPQTMPLTGLANAAIDHIGADPTRFVEEIVAYAGNDLLCYRAEAPPKLIAREAASWDPLIAWAAERYGANFSVVSGLMPHRQTLQTLEAVRQAIVPRDVFALAGLFSIVTLTGSTILGLALADEHLPADDVWERARVDEIVQAEAWGIDAEAKVRTDRMGEELKTVARFLDLLRQK